MLIKRLYFTLLELLVVLTILGAITGVIGINVSKAFRDQHFRSEVDLIVDQLRLAQDMMLLFNAEVSFKITKQKDGTFKYFLEFANGLPKRWGSVIKGQHQPLSHIKSITFETHVRLSADDSPLDLRFGDKGNKMSRGVLRLASDSTSSNQTLERFICLPGYPSNISSTASPAAVEKCMKMDEAIDRQLTLRTIEEVNEDS